jgi:hypothetical protein
VALTSAPASCGSLFGCAAALLTIFLRSPLTLAQRPSILPRLPPPSELKPHIALTLGCAGGADAAEATVRNDGVAANTRVLLGMELGGLGPWLFVGLQDDRGVLYWNLGRLPRLETGTDPWIVD